MTGETIAVFLHGSEHTHYLQLLPLAQRDGYQASPFPALGVNQDPAEKKRKVGRETLPIALFAPLGYCHYADIYHRHNCNWTLRLND